MWRFRWGRTQWSGTSAPIYSEVGLSRPADFLHQFVDLFCDRLFDLWSERPGEGAVDQGVATLVAALMEHTHGGNVAEHVVGISGDPGVVPSVFGFEPQRVVHHHFAAH